mmetsp:Transcript_49726/g.118532  ORF Transcript_49726/g.118532 Transcript_49726/m.118532 type:complete len:477 (-) Transcript_49726:87-1517(-)
MMARPHTAPCQRPPSANDGEVLVLVQEMLSSAACKAVSSTDGQLSRPHTACVGLQPVVVSTEGTSDSDEESDGGDFDADDDGCLTYPSAAPQRAAAAPPPPPQAACKADILTLDDDGAAAAASDARKEEPQKLQQQRPASARAAEDVVMMDLAHLPAHEALLLRDSLSSRQQSRPGSALSVMTATPQTPSLSSTARPRGLTEQVGPRGSSGFALRGSASSAAGPAAKKQLPTSLGQTQKEQLAPKELAEKLPKSHILAASGGGSRPAGIAPSAAVRSHVSWLHHRPGPAGRAAPSVEEPASSTDGAAAAARTDPQENISRESVEDAAAAVAKDSSDAVQEESATRRKGPKYRVVAGASRPMASKAITSSSSAKKLNNAEQSTFEVRPSGVQPATAEAASKDAREIVFLEFRTQPRVVPASRTSKPPGTAKAGVGYLPDADGCGRVKTGGKVEAVAKMRFRPAARGWAKQREALVMR